MALHTALWGHFLTHDSRKRARCNQERTAQALDSSQSPILSRVRLCYKKEKTTQNQEKLSLTVLEKLYRITHKEAS